MNVNGPFPGGGAGSTEFLTAGVGGDGLTVNRGGASGSGGWTAVTSDGGSSREYRMYKSAGEQFAESGQFAAGSSSAPGGAHNASDPYYAGFGDVDVASLPVQGVNNGGPAQQDGRTQTGSFGMEWHEITLIVDADGGTGGAASMEWLIDGLSIGTLDAGIGSAFDTDGSVTIGYMGVFSSVSDNAFLSFGLVDNLRVVPDNVDVVPEPSALLLLGLGALGLAAFRLRWWQPVPRRRIVIVAEVRGCCAASDRSRNVAQLQTTQRQALARQNAAS
jgi:hypothetical protein